MSAHQSDQRPWVVLVGGFLGAGKTSLILAAAKILMNRNVRCAAILNDQGEELVDTYQTKRHGIDSREVTGGCFCCRFSQLHSAIDALLAHAPEVIFAEPVGSCTDLVATVLEPLREEFDLCRVAPFTVLVDPARAEALQRPGADPNLLFLWQKQLQEVDLVCTSKSDLYPNAKAIPGVSARHLSAVTGHGVQAWLDEVLGGSLPSGTHLLDIDYERYARAEAALAWLNLSLSFEPRIATTPALVAGPFLQNLDEALSSAGIIIVHLKLIVRSSQGWLKAAICENHQEPIVEGDLDASPASCHDLLLNLRVLGNPEQVKEIVEQKVESLPGNTYRMRLNCFSPAPPKPERRMVRMQT